MRTPLLSIRVDPETKERWTGEAKAAGLSLSDFIRSRVDHAPTKTTTPSPRAPRSNQERLSPTRAPQERPSGAKTDQAVTRRVTLGSLSAPVKGACVRARFHRPGTFCKECGKVPT